MRTVAPASVFAALELSSLAPEVFLDGDPGLGKSTLLFDLAARVSRLPRLRLDRRDRSRPHRPLGGPGSRRRATHPGRFQVQHGSQAGQSAVRAGKSRRRQPDRLARHGAASGQPPRGTSAQRGPAPAPPDGPRLPGVHPAFAGRLCHADPERENGMPGRLQLVDDGVGRPQSWAGLDTRLRDEHVVLAESGQRLRRLTPLLAILAVGRAFRTELHVLQSLADRQVHRQLAVDLAVEWCKEVRER